MAASGITLTSGMRQSLFSLQGTSKLMDRTSSRLSSGKEVQSALDDPVNFFAAQGHTQRAGDLAGRKDEMGEAIQTIKAANNGIEAIQDLIASAKSTAQSAQAIDATATTTAQDYKDRSALLVQFETLRTQIDELAQDSGYKGLNFLQQSTMTVEFAENVGDANLEVVGFDGDAAGLSIDSGSGQWTTDALITAAIADLDDARSTLRTKAKELSNALSTITTREEFTSNMINTLEDGAANLVNADMNEESANMLMLQTRQNLGTSSLSMASQAAQAVLRLF
jgi:flagellin-like hook-associated protein FlgL